MPSMAFFWHFQQAFYADANVSILIPILHKHYNIVFISYTRQVISVNYIRQQESRSILFFTGRNIYKEATCKRNRIYFVL